ncbi:MAG: nicotinamide-nucleotide amidohydrolase family protein, partial [Armatimonadetes bacterium]|nr:nicotinamide-nucleotide amidohydrolase family protein [Akkermansiaceae bacterium]
ATAESCTGGLIVNRITNIPGASEVFTHGWVTYSNMAKADQLGVETSVITKSGAVSEEVARQMAKGALEKSGADIAVSITGIAGPDGGTEEKPVGTAWIGLAINGGETLAIRVFHPRNRKDFKQSVSQSALNMIRIKLG